MSLIADTLYSLRPDAKWIIVGDDVYENIQWTDDTVPPTKEEFEQELARLRQLTDDTAYREQRAAEYPAIGDQLDALFHAGVFPPEMAAAIQAIKDKYPKPE